MARETWTDERLDDLEGQMNERFDQVDQHFVQVETTMKEGFARVDAEMNQRFGQVDQRFDRVETTMKEGFARIDGDVRELRGDIKEMKRLMIQGFIGICTLMFAALGITAF